MWRPMDEAPKDGTVILAKIRGHSEILIVAQVVWESGLLHGWHLAYLCFHDESTDCDPIGWLPIVH